MAACLRAQPACDADRTIRGSASSFPPAVDPDASDLARRMPAGLNPGVAALVRAHRAMWMSILHECLDDSLPVPLDDCFGDLLTRLDAVGRGEKEYVTPAALLSGPPAWLAGALRATTFAAP